MISRRAFMQHLLAPSMVVLTVACSQAGAKGFDPSKMLDNSFVDAAVAQGLAS